MKNMRKGLLGLLLVFSMVVSMLPLTAGAAEEPADTLPDTSEMSVISELKVVPDADDLPDNDELFEGWQQQQLYGNYGISLFADYGKETLSGSTLALYNELKMYIEQIASGDRASTIIEWPNEFGCTWTFEELGVAGINSTTELKNVVSAEIYKVMSCLLVDCPYELYWFDKTEGWNFPFYYRLTETELIIDFMEADLPVATEYQGGDAFTVDTSKARATKTAVENARAVVAANEGKSDYEKLVAYQQYICSVVEYNEAALDPNTPYGNPWQLIWVFDEDPSTDVVCEGYSKAFQYLCDLSTFKGDVVCYTVTGGMGIVEDFGAVPDEDELEAHMWNIVTMGDGQNYLVDVTNSDYGDEGRDILFLLGTESRSTDNMAYTFWYSTVGGGYVGFYYEYDWDTWYTYGDGADSVLVLAREKYHEHTPAAPVRENEVAATCTTDGSYDEVVYCADDSCGEEISRETKVIPAAGHDFNEWTTVKAATCTEKGQEERVCKVCGEKETREIAPLGHEFGAWTTVEAATCTEKGQEERVCKVCGEKETREIAPLGHTFGEWTIEKEPTCTEKGSETAICEVCGKEETREIAELGHDYQVIKEGKEPTCTEDGVSATEKCSRCGDVKGGEVIPALGHDYQVTKVAKEATCTEDGNTEEQTCSRCGDVKGGEVLPAFGHDYQVTKEAKDPTCTEDGNTEEQTCSHCGDVKGGEVIPALGHEVSEWTIEKEPTCTEKGSETGICEVCGEEVTREIAELGHDWKLVKEGKEPTCTESGVTKTEECSRCGEVRGGEEVPALGHQWDEGKVTKEPTTTTEGEKVYTCEVCGETKTEKIPVITEAEPEQPAETTKPSDKPDTTQNGAPKTGDNSSVMIWVMLLIASGACVAGAGVVSQKRKRNR